MGFPTLLPIRVRRLFRTACLTAGLLLAVAAPAAHAQSLPPDGWWNQYASETGFNDALWRLGTSVAAMNSNPSQTNSSSKNMLTELYWLWWVREIYPTAGRDAYQIPVLTANADISLRTTESERGTSYFAKVSGRAGDTAQIDVGAIPSGVSCQASTLHNFHNRALKWETNFVTLKSNGSTSYTFKDAGILGLGCAIPQKWPGQAPIGVMVPVRVAGGEPAPIYIFGQTPLSEWSKLASTTHEGDYVYLVDGRSQFAMPNAMAVQNPNVHINTWLWSHLRTVLKYEQLNGYGSAQDINAVEHGVFTASLADCCAAFQRRGDLAVGWSGPINIWTSWGDWHEYGHQYQSRWGWSWTSSLSETTVNIFSLVACRMFKGDPSDIDLRTCHPALKDRYWDQQAVKAFLASGVSYSDFDAQDNWTKLSMFAKLLFTYGEGFYSKIDVAVRAANDHGLGAANFNTDQKKRDWFALNASIASGHDLRVYFARWGLKISQSTLDEIKALNLPQPDAVAKPVGTKAATISPFGAGSKK